MQEPIEVTASEFRIRQAMILEQVERGEHFIVTQNGIRVAALLPVGAADWCAALERRFRDRLPPFTQEALNTWMNEALAAADLSGLVRFPE